MLALYTLAVFVSAFLLFSVQPFVGKVLLPVMGGTPAVWNTCMLFFQAALLAGYGYAHVTSRWMNLRRQGVLHLALFGVAFVFIPVDIELSSHWTASPTWPLLVALTTSIGLPFVLNSTSAPLLQRWFAQTDHAMAVNPYPLYAASNAGSLLALLAYPVAIERWLSVSEQSVAHGVAFAVLALLVAGCLGLAWRATQRHGEMSASDDVASPTWRERAYWLLMAFIPSSLLLGVTLGLTLDVAAIPMLWVLPLAVYILSFVLVFSQRRLPHDWWVWLYPIGVVALAPILITRTSSPVFGVALAHLGVFFAACMAFHGELNRTKPDPRHLTEFYLVVSVGGVLGGLFNAVIAPEIFDSVAEYPVVLVLSVAALAVPAYRHRNAFGGLALAAVVGVGVMTFSHDLGLVVTLLAALAPVLLAGIFWKASALRVGVPLTYALLWVALSQNTREVLFEDRGYFGVSSVIVDPATQSRLLYHGTTNHGGQSTRAEFSRWMVPYHYPGSPIGQAWHALSKRRPGSQVAVMGLGAGGLACMAGPGEKVTFFEIDPVVERLARDPALFTFLRDCPADVVMGDGRIMMAQEPNQRFGLIVLDVLGSDAMPMHLYTREAVDTYIAKLAADGMLVFHISSRFTDVTPMLASMAADLGWVWRVQYHVPPDDSPIPLQPTRVFVMAPSEADLGDVATSPAWVTRPERVPAWTDQRANLLSVVRY